MSRFFFIVALLGIMLQNFGSMYILLHFKINRDYIAKSLCVKKNEPGNCCKGSCYLNKQLKEEDKKEKSPTSAELKDKTETQFCETILQFLFYPFTFTQQPAPYYPLISDREEPPVFQPPEV